MPWNPSLALVLCGVWLAVAGAGAIAAGRRVSGSVPRLAAAALPPSLLLVAVHGYAIERSYWFFNTRFVSGVEVPPGLPVEELGLLLVVPVAGICVLEAARRLLGER